MFIPRQGSDSLPAGPPPSAIANNALPECLPEQSSRGRKPPPQLLPIWYLPGMDLNIKGLDDDVGKRLRHQAAAAGVSMQQYLRTELTRIASRLSPAEFVRGHRPMTRDEFLSIRQRLREIDAS